MFPLSWKVTVPGSVPTEVSPASGKPVTETVNEPGEPTVNVVLLALVNAGGTSTVTCVVAVVEAGVVAELVTVRV